MAKVTSNSTSSPVTGPLPPVVWPGLGLMVPGPGFTELAAVKLGFKTAVEEVVLTRHSIRCINIGRTTGAAAVRVLRSAMTMAAADRRAKLQQSSTLDKLGREGVRLAGQVVTLVERSYEKTFLRVESTMVDVG